MTGPVRCRLPANSTGSVTLTSIPGDPATESDEADIHIDARLTDVRRADDLSDYAPSEFLVVVLEMRRTDKTKYAPAYPREGATGEDFSLRLSLNCTPTASASVGATCTRTSTLDALAYDFTGEGHRTTWEITSIRVEDLGLDNDIETTGDNRTVAVSGVFVP